MSSSFFQHRGSTISGALLISGTCIGAGMLALPVVTGLAGFVPGLVVNALCCLFMLATGLLFLEATLWMPDGANVLSMAEHFLGPVGKWVCGISFLFLYYCIMVAYLSGGSPIICNLCMRFFGMGVGSYATILMGLLFGGCVWVGAYFVDRVNGILMVGLVLSYVLLLGLGGDDVEMELLSFQHWPLAVWAVPTLFGAYGFHNIVPTLCTYLKRDRKRLQRAIVCGTLFPFLIYSMWQWLIIGAIPQDQLQAAAHQGVPIAQILGEVATSPWVGTLALYLSLFAIVTSLLGVALSVVDFLGDGFHMVERKGVKRLGLCLLAFIPPTIFAIVYPSIFMQMLGIAGGFGEAILNGLMPVALVWIGRYHGGLPRHDHLPGGRGLLSILFLLTLFVMGLEAYYLFW